MKIHVEEEEKTIDTIILIGFFILVFMLCLVCAVLSSLWQNDIYKPVQMENLFRVRSLFLFYLLTLSL